jgi:hypothetical protein
MSCMILNDWTNSHAEEDKMKASRNKIRNIHSKSLLATKWAVYVYKISLKKISKNGYLQRHSLQQ